MSDPRVPDEPGWYWYERPEGSFGERLEIVRLWRHPREDGPLIERITRATPESMATRGVFHPGPIPTPEVLDGYRRTLERLAEYEHPVAQMESRGDQYGVGYARGACSASFKVRQKARSALPEGRR